MCLFLNNIEVLNACILHCFYNTQYPFLLWFIYVISVLLLIILFWRSTFMHKWSASGIDSLIKFMSCCIKWTAHAASRIIDILQINGWHTHPLFTSHVRLLWWAIVTIPAHFLRFCLLFRPTVRCYTSNVRCFKICSDSSFNDTCITIFAVTL